MLDTTNQLSGEYGKGFLTHWIGELVKEIPAWRRDSLAAEIKARASLFGAQNEDALKKALRRLQERTE